MVKSSNQDQFRLRDFVVRLKPDQGNPYVMVKRAMIENKTLSWEARGLLAYLHCRSGDGAIFFSELVEQSPGGTHGLRRILRELDFAGCFINS